MKKLQFFLILLVVGALFVPAVLAENHIVSSLPYSDTKNEQSFDYYSGTVSYTQSNRGGDTTGNLIVELVQVQYYTNVHYFMWDAPGDVLTGEGQTTCWYSRPSDGAWKPATLQIIKTRNALGAVTRTVVYVYPLEWDVGTKTGTWSTILYRDADGVKSNTPLKSVSIGYYNAKYDATLSKTGGSDNYKGGMYLKLWNSNLGGQKTHVEGYTNLKYTLDIDEFGTSYIVDMIRTIGATSSTTTITLKDASSAVLFQDTAAIDKEFLVAKDKLSSVEVVAGIYTNNYIISLGDAVTPTPTNPPHVVSNRTGTVTMTDNNGTTISGFEVTAVNAYTDEEYTVATQSDVAVMNLPMERTIQIRNPQTGEYEEAPIGYYRFYGQAPGYKMLAEDGIKVSVMPEKYGSYQLCDIRVTSESGYLTGNHQFQIRSRSDNTVLQTGTISAKSVTTGEWYNTTLSGGIATMILPYDTSNSISQYAGNYAVYATSPGYEDSDYGTQIVVMPHTVSEIRDILLTPIGGIPTPGNVTLRIQAFSETGPGVVNAEIFIAGVLGEGSSVWDTYTASSTGYLTVSVPGNSTYDIVASGAGYYDSARRVEVLSEDPPLIEIKLYPSGAPTLEPTTQPTGWPTTQPTTQPTGGIPDEDDDSEGFLMQAVRGIGLAFGVGFSTAKLIFGMLLALSIGYATAKQLRGGAAEFGFGLLGGTLLGVLIGLLPVWIIVVLLLVVGLYIGNRYVGGANNG